MSEFYFVTPKFENRLIVKNLPSCNNQLKQYVLELDLKSIYDNKDK